nr:reverse transcriptase domain-containing protein [Tanacetum cinerariifolium]
MANKCTMSELLQAPTEGYRDAIVLPPILVENFELKEDLLHKFVKNFFPPSKTTNIKNDITNFQQIFDESFGEAWDRFKDLLRKCPHHGFSELHQIDIFYNALTQSDQDSLNAATGGNLLNRTPRDALMIIENKSKVPVRTHNQGGNGYRPQGDPNYRASNQMRPPGFPSPNVQNSPNYNQNCFVDALLHMPKFASTFKSLLSNKEKLFELVTTPLNENCSALLLKKLPKKLRDPGKFLILCDFSELKECLALADLGASINLMPLSIWKKLSLPELTHTRMTLKLANRLVTYPVGIAEDVLVKVGKFYFPGDFVVVDYDVDPRVPLILGRPFLRTARALIDVYGEELTLQVNDEAIMFKVGHTLRYSCNYYEESVNLVNVIDVACEE